jgi:hypothetical protein
MVLLNIGNRVRLVFPKSARRYLILRIKQCETLLNITACGFRISVVCQLYFTLSFAITWGFK